MTRFALAAVLFLTACGPSAPPPQSAPTASSEDADRTVSKEGGFSVVFPAPPEKSERKVETGIGTIALHDLGVAVTTPGAMGAFTVTWADMPDTGDVHMVDVTRELVKKPPRVLLSETPIEIVPGVVKGYELVYEDGDFEKTARVFMAARRYYQVMVEHPKGQTPAGMRRFFDTFRLQ